MAYKMFIFTLIFLSSSMSFAIRQTQGRNLLGVSQGISSPSMTSTLNFSNGYTGENPMGVIYQQTVRVTGQYAHDNDDSNQSAYGAEVGFGNGQLGLAAGYFNRDCPDCEGRYQGAIGLSLNRVALGVRIAENQYSAGLLISPYGQHRFGVLAEFNNLDGDDNNITSYGVGYTYMAPQFSFSIDASKRDFENPLGHDDTIQVSPALAFYLQQFSFSITYDHYLDKANTPNSEDDQLWAGLGFGEENSWHTALYYNYVNDWSVALSLFF